MTRQEEMDETEKLRKMAPEEMMKIDPSEYYGQQDRCSWLTLVDEHANLPLPILETEDDDFIREYIAQWYDVNMDEDSSLKY